mmetsp:Transcript_12448/g.15587  ORF Transcript_12448/g.15587 Transcript_12448/m.15587 type:complete len:398 (-) Transcript_12448:178-1371(-)|eukprot:CAMPEP_0172502648 /NCGR_PEP_ID=MMETSP1066-20121228/161666_1 /TAXON_ID=671091 /ORGANISM="Coscinodiscus wailesii, Strain CCMP2513" /LENGTH=397 /DNA_ID=CAMNT_0013277973 /DNA_START=100 /DNA_END=1293 /DNA_ORIENTATION=-
MRVTQTFVLALALAITSTSSTDLRLDGGNSLGWDESAWRTQVDGVMGGRSTGDLSFVDDGTTMVFTGNINLIGGGFSSVRRNFRGTGTPIDLSPYAGIVVSVETDQFLSGGSVASAPLGLHLQLHDSKSYWGFAAAFAVPLAMEARRTVDVFVPLESFDRGSRSGWRCNRCSLDVTAVNGMDVYVLFQEGPFQVRLKSVTAVGDVRAYQSPAIDFGSNDDVESLLLSTIKSGGSLYDKGYVELCVSIYWSSLNSIIAASAGVTGAIKTVACAGLKQTTKDMSKTAQAWTLRYTMDAILADLRGVDRDRKFEWLPPSDDGNSGNEDGVCKAITSMVSGYPLSDDKILFSTATATATSYPDETVYVKTELTASSGTIMNSRYQSTVIASTVVCLLMLFK